MAEPVLARALQLDPVNPEAQAALGALRAAQSRFEEADAAYRRSLELNPSNVHALTSYGSFLTDAGDLDAARGFLDRAVELDPLSNRVLWNAGVPDMFSGREHQVMQFVTRMQAIDSKAPQSVYGEVFMYLTSGRLDLAVPIGRRAMALDPEDFELVAHQAAMHIDLGDLDRAVALVRQALALGPDEPFPLAVQAALTLRQGDLSGAATIARRAADMGLENRHGSEWIFLSILRMDAARSGDYAGYLEQIRALVQPQLLESPPRPFWWWDVFSAVHMSYAYRQLERQQEREQLDQALRAKLYGVSEGLREHQMPWVEAAMLAMDGQGDMAMEVLERATGSGFRFWWMLKDDPIFAPIASTARFKAILGGFEERYGAQFRNLQASEATPGDGKKTQ
jgi:Flp pilus assembly protein TadD